MPWPGLTKEKKQGHWSEKPVDSMKWQFLYLFLDSYFAQWQIVNGNAEAFLGLSGQRKLDTKSVRINLD